MTVLLQSIEEMRSWRAQRTGSVGFVPTMGALHVGHGELLKKSVNENQQTVLSIFVNPTQFNDPKDFENYPTTWTQDFEMAQNLQVDAVFAPTRQLLYPDHYRYRLTELDFSKSLCGAHRPGHFDGVLTIVMKLFSLVRPTRAYFGEKDHQQLKLIQGMVAAFFLDVEVVPVPTVRDIDGLAMSSRNRRLSGDQRQLAPLLHRVLCDAKTAEQAIHLLSESGFRVDYVTDLGTRRYAAAFLGETRLIDNVEIANEL